MSNEITVTVADASLPEIWIGEALRSRYAKAVVAKSGVVLFKTVEVAKRGDNIDFTEIGSLTVSSVGDDGTVANLATTQTQRQVALSRWREVTWEIVDRADIQSILDLKREFAVAAGAALAEDMDDAVLDDHGSITTNTEGSTTSPSTLTDNLILAAMQDLDDGDVPAEDRHFVFAPKAKAELLKIDKFVLAYATGKSVGSQMTGEFGAIYGVPILVTSRVVSTGTPAVRKNLLLHKECIAMGMQRNINIETFARIAKSTRVSADALYGEAVIRENHGVVINTAA